MRVFKRGFRLLTLSCEDAAFLISSSLDGRFAWSERLAIRLHGLYCPGCRRFESQLKLLRSTLAGWKARTKDGSASGLLLPSPDVRERIRVALEEASDSSRPS